MVSKSPSHPIVASCIDLVMRPLLPVRQRVVPWATGDVLEVGCGTGANFPFYRDVRSVTAIEPDPHMRKRAEQVATEGAVPVTLLDASGERLPFEGERFDTVVATFVLCTIPEPQRAVEEMWRVLRPGGAVVFAEHVAAEGAAMHRVQRGLTPLWKRVAGGCRLDNEALAQWESAGFTVELMSPLRASSHPFPVVYGRAWKKATSGL